MPERQIFLASMEAKDIHCLEPLVPSLQKRFDAVRVFDPYDEIVHQKRDALTAFAKAELPVVVVSSVGTIETLNLIRPRETYLCLGIEHGIAPFKAYTYGRGLLSSDFYLAPTRGWAERLVRLYPGERAKIRLGGYPKIETMRDHLRRPGHDRGPLIVHSSSQRMLVLLSWGVREDVSELLPDLSFIDYLLHPADEQKLSSFKFRNARVHVSRPEVTYPLIAEASLILGDFSSLTLECMSLGKEVLFLLDPSLYEGSCDLEATFSRRDSADFGRIPFTTDGIDPARALSASQLVTLTADLGCDVERWNQVVPQASIASDYLPPIGTDNRELCADEISDIVELCLPIGGRSHHVPYSRDAIQTLGFLSDAYRAILSRPPDRSGLKHYLPRIYGAGEKDRSLNAIGLCQELNRSSEAAAKREVPLGDDSVDKILAILANDAGVDPGRACQTLDALNELVLPKFHRLRRDEADNDVERIHYGYKLVSGRRVEFHDLVDLAHACGRVGRLSDALCWITKAIALRADDAALLRFQASMLERLGQIDQALTVAEKARLLGPDPSALSADIIRLLEGQAADLRRRSAGCHATERLACYAKLHAIGAAQTDDLIHLAQSFANEEKLADALFWLSKAIEDRPQDGELFRFRASLLERLGRLSEALENAEKAHALGADRQPIESDIQRLRKKCVAEFRTFVRSTALSECLTAHANLLNMGEQSLLDFLRLFVHAAIISFRSFLGNLTLALRTPERRSLINCRE